MVSCLFCYWNQFSSKCQMTSKAKWIIAEGYKCKSNFNDLWIISIYYSHPNINCHFFKNQFQKSTFDLLASKKIVVKILRFPSKDGLDLGYCNTIWYFMFGMTIKIVRLSVMVIHRCLWEIESCARIDHKY